MSRDLTPKETLDMQKHMRIDWKQSLSTYTFTRNGITQNVYMQEELNYIFQFQYIGRCSERVLITLFRKYGNKHLEVFKEIDRQLTEFIKNEIIPEYSWIEEWFLGYLDKNFYYSENNDKLFVERIERLI